MPTSQDPTSQDPTIQDAVNAIEASSEILIRPQLGHVVEWVCIAKKEARDIFDSYLSTMPLSNIDVVFETCPGTVYFSTRECPNPLPDFSSEAAA